MRRFAVSVNGLHLGELLSIPDGTLFTFDEDVRKQPDLPVLSQSFLNERGAPIDSGLCDDVVPFFANLLPEAGPLRRFLASRHEIPAEDDLAMLAALGENLPGAVRVVALEDDGTPVAPRPQAADARWRFSLAGVQMKFSAARNGGRWSVATIDRPGDWIVKLASADTPAVVENEFAMMSLAAACGLNVPEIALINVEDIDGLEQRFRERGSRAFAIRRFDRSDGARIHQEDLCQITVRAPSNKYAEYGTPFGLEDALRIVNELCGLADAREFVRRFALNFAVGNGDAHLKNFAVVYPDGRNARLSPLYDVVCTLRYEHRDSLALKVAGEDSFTRIDRGVLRALAQASGVSSRIVMREFAAMADRVAQAWPAIAATIEDHDLRSIVSHRVANPLARLARVL